MRRHFRESGGMEGMEELQGGERLAVMRRRAFGLLCLVAALLVCARAGASTYPGLKWLAAFSEAALVGGLADWFAVVALFRHPLGVPIPHTAILRTRQRRISRTLGRFVAENFLTRAVVAKQLERADLVALVCRLGRAESPALSRYVLSLLPKMLDALSDAEVADFLNKQFERQVRAIPLAPLAGQLLGLLTAGGRHEAVLDEMLRMISGLLAEHRSAIEEGVKAELPVKWLMELFDLDKSIADRVLEKMSSFLRGVESDRSHPVRVRFGARMRQFVDELQHSRVYLEKGEQLKAELLSNKTLIEYSQSVWADLRRHVLERLSAPDSLWGARLEQLVVDLLAAIERDEVLALRLNVWLRDLASGLVDAHRSEIARLIESTVNSWDADLMSSKIEHEVGADLQFIRINGTLIGGLAGLLIHAITEFFLYF
jgi:uncharacterized membrane-anchored protein YjiN (DUF445 family)